MNTPILESLNFTFETDLSDILTPSSSLSQPLYSRSPINKPPTNSKKILPSSTILSENNATPCLIKGCTLISPPISVKENKDKFLAHLLTQHYLVIEDVDKIANLHKYIIYWKEKFSEERLSDFCVGFLMEDVPVPQKNNKDDKPKDKPTYYMLTHALEEDKELRSKLWNSRLETILEVNREEREQKDFSKNCFFCRKIFTGNRSIFFHHLYEDHSFHIGKPDNVVFVEEFLDIIGKKLDSLLCLHCEKTFKSKEVLRDHMRKKGHKKLNSENPEYNRYYLVNYLEPGRDWKELESEDQEDERIEEDWTEANEEKSNIVCLFCSEKNSNFEEILGHMKEKHQFNFLGVTEGFDFYRKVKIVNFIRRTVFLNTCLFCELKFLERTSLTSHVGLHFKNKDAFPSEVVWNQPEHFFPTYENDEFLLQLDLNDLEDDTQIVIPEDLPDPTFSTMEQDYGLKDDL